MRTSSRAFGAAGALASGLLLACGGNSTSDDGGVGGSNAGPSGNGVSGSGGSGSIATECAPFTACGGDVVGTWQLVSICDGTGFAGIPGADCATIHGNPSFDSTTSLVFDAGGTYTTTGQVQFSADESFNDACAQSTFMENASDACAGLTLIDAASSQTGVHFRCSTSNGLCNCRIAATVPQNTSGTYRVSGTAITLTPVAGTQTSTVTTPLDGTSQFCVQGTTVTVRGNDGTLTTLTK